MNLILESEGSEILSEGDSFLLDGFDRAVLILDDIEDRSQVRDGKPCFYMVRGTMEAREEAQRLYKDAFLALDAICRQRGVGTIRSFYARFLLERLYRRISLGQRIDKQIQSEDSVCPRLVSKYDHMILLFTGGHIKYGFLIGFLLSGKKTPYKNKVASIGEDIGILRQMCDDIEDYEDRHHEALGDLINHKKRLPELLFRLSASPEEKSKLDILLSDSCKNQAEIKELVFNEAVLKQILEKTSSIQKRIISKMEGIPERYKSRLNQLMLQFQHE